MQKLSTIVLWVLAIVSIVLAGMYFFGGTDMINGVEDVPVFYDINIYWAAILFVLTVVIVLFFTIEYLVTHPKSLKGAAIALVSALVLLGVSYALASGDPIPGARNEAALATPQTLKWVEVGIIATYILGGLALAAMVISEIYRAFR